MMVEGLLPDSMTMRPGTPAFRAAAMMPAAAPMESRSVNLWPMVYTVEALEIKGYRYAAVDKQVKRMKLRTLQVTTNDFLVLALSLLWISLAMLGSALF